MPDELRSLVTRILNLKLDELNQALSARRDEIAAILSRPEIDKDPKAVNRLLSTLDREEFATVLRKLLGHAGIKDPDKVCDEGGYCFIGPMGRRLKELGDVSPESLAVHWLLQFREVRRHEAQLAEERARLQAIRDRKLRGELTLGEMYLRLQDLLVNGIPEKGTSEHDEYQRLRRMVSEVKAAQQQSSGTPPKLAVSKRPLRSDLQSQRDEGRDRYNTKRAAEAEQWKADLPLLEAEYLRRHPHVKNKTQIAKWIEGQLAERKRAEDRQRAQNGEEERTVSSPKANTIRRYIRLPE